MEEYISKYCMHPGGRDCLNPGICTATGKVRKLICQFYSGDTALPKNEKFCTFPDYGHNGLTKEQHLKMCSDQRNKFKNVGKSR